MLRAGRADAEALARGNTLRRPTCVHYTGDQIAWPLETFRLRL
jgi:hypothetical protein